MLGSPQPEMAVNAAGALATLSRDNAKNQAAIARTGAIAPLCTLLREGDAPTKDQEQNTSGKRMEMVYHAITAAPAYRTKSFEELRVEDYKMGNKGRGGAAPAGGFGATTSPFGAPVCDRVEVILRRVASTPRLRRGLSVERVDAAATTRIVRVDAVAQQRSSVSH